MMWTYILSVKMGMVKRRWIEERLGREGRIDRICGCSRLEGKTME